MKRLPISFVCACLLLIGACACKKRGGSPMDDYKLAVISALNGNGYPAEFNRLYPGASNIISYFTGAIGQPAWTSSIGLHDRYVLKMHHIIEFGKARTNIVSSGSPMFYLYEVPSITPRTNGGFNYQMRDIATFGLNGWRRLVESKGDFSILGITLETNKPVEHFQEAWSKL
jgi:hypothetical protein